MADSRARSHRPLVLIVEDNPELSRQLGHLLERHGMACITAENESDAIQKASQVDAIVADIDLSEAGGDERGGIRLAERLAQQGSRLPIILISYTPWVFLPPKESPEYRDLTDRLGVGAVLDRNQETFREELIDCLRRSQGGRRS